MVHRFYGHFNLPRYGSLVRLLARDLFITATLLNPLEMKVETIGAPRVCGNPPASFVRNTRGTPFGVPSTGRYALVKRIYGIVGCEKLTCSVPPWQFRFLVGT